MAGIQFPRWTLHIAPQRRDDICQIAHLRSDNPYSNFSHLEVLICSKILHFCNIRDEKIKIQPIKDTQ